MIYIVPVEAYVSRTGGMGRLNSCLVSAKNEDSARGKAEILLKEEEVNIIHIGRPRPYDPDYERM